VVLADGWVGHLVEGGGQGRFIQTEHAFFYRYEHNDRRLRSIKST
jgi:hypothetical protein